MSSTTKLEKGQEGQEDRGLESSKKKMTSGCQHTLIQLESFGYLGSN
ncbi:hypothetical protein NC652_009079 [Populus alba x Populus x berolinensis]|nr:hypothetical protein NC652_009079 [Populus alba x Populus x berolinensis]